MASGSSGKKSNIFVYALIAIILLAITGIVVNNLNKDDDTVKVQKDSVKEKTADLNNEKNQIVDENNHENLIETLIKEAVQFGDEEQNYIAALEKLNEAKNSYDPLPTTEQNFKIDELIVKYQESANERVEQAREESTQIKIAENMIENKEDPDVVNNVEPKKAPVKMTAAKNNNGKKSYRKSSKKSKKSNRTTKIARKQKANKIIESPSVNQNIRKTKRTTIVYKSEVDESEVIDYSDVKVAPKDPEKELDDEIASVNLDSKLPVLNTQRSVLPIASSSIASDSDMKEEDRGTIYTMNQSVAITSEGNFDSKGKREGESDALNKEYPTPDLGIDPSELEKGLGDNEIDKLISQAKKYGTDKKFRLAIQILYKAKSYVEPEPTEEQLKEIDSLLSQYMEAYVDAQIDYAEALGKNNKYVEAVNMLKDILNQTSPRPNDRQKQRIQDLLDKYKIEMEQFLGKENKRLAEEYFKKGMKELAKKHYDEAEFFFEQAIQLEPDHILAYSYKGTAHLKKGEYDLAIASSDEALKRDPEEPNAHFTKGEIYYGKYQDTKAEEEYNQVIAKDTGYAYAYYKLGVIMLLSSRNSDAEAMFTKALEVTGPGALDIKYQRNAYYNRGVALERTHKLNEAAEDYKRAIALDSRYYKGYIQLGEVYYKQNKYEESTRILREALTYKKNDFNLNFLLGKVYDTISEKERTNKLFDLSLKHYKRALEAKPNDFDTLYNTGRIYLKKTEPANAVEYFARAYEIKNTDFNLLVDYGAAYCGMDKFEEGLAIYDEALAIDDQAIDSYIGKGGIYFNRSKQADGSRDVEDLRKAVTNLEFVVERNGSIYEVNKTLGTCYFFIAAADNNPELFAKAEEILKRSVEKKPNDYQARRNLATTYFKQSKFKEAIPHYEEANRIDDGMPEPYLRLYECNFMLAQAEKEAGNMEKMEEYKDIAGNWVQQLTDRFPEYKDQRRIYFYDKATNGRRKK